MSVEIKTEIPCAWDIVANTREKVEEMLSHLDTELIEASSMVASELIENAVKYGVSVPNCPKAECLVEMTEDEVVIAVANGCNSDKALENVMEQVDRVASADEPGDLYLARLQEMMERPFDTSNQLGLIRIAYEGKFELSREIGDKSIRIIARRRIKE